MFGMVSRCSRGVFEGFGWLLGLSIRGFLWVLEENVSLLVREGTGLALQNRLFGPL